MSEMIVSHESSTNNSVSKNADQKFCFACGKLIHLSASQCPTCGALQTTVTNQPALVPDVLSESSALSALKANHVYCRGCGTGIHESATSCPKCGAPQSSTYRTFTGESNRVPAALFAIFLGWVGGHKFYLGKIFQGLLYLFFCWTFIPAIIGFIEGIIYLTMSDQEFGRKYS